MIKKVLRTLKHDDHSIWMDLNAICGYIIHYLNQPDPQPDPRWINGRTLFLRTFLTHFYFRHDKKSTKLILKTFISTDYYDADSL